MSAFYSEMRPAYVDEASYTATITIDGSGTISGQTFSAAMFKPDGTAATGTPTAVILVAADRTVTLTLPTQTIAGEYSWAVRRTDDASNLVVAHGVIDIQNTGGRGTV